MNRIGFFMALLAGVATFSVVAPSRASAAQKVAVVDVKRAMEATDHWKKAVAKLKVEKESREKSLEETRVGLKSKYEALLAQKELLTKENFETKARALETEQAQLARTFMVRQQELVYLEKAYYTQMIKRIESVVRQLAFEDKYLVIVDSGDESSPNVLYAKKGIDVTKKVIKSYNKLFSGKPLQEPKIPSAPAGQP